MVEVDKVSPVGAGSVSAGRQGALVAEPRPRPRPHPRQHQPRDHTGRRGRGETRFAIPFPATMLCAGLSLARKQPRRESEDGYSGASIAVRHEEQGGYRQADQAAVWSQPRGQDGGLAPQVGDDIELRTPSRSNSRRC